MTSTTSLSATILPTITSTTTNGVSHIDLAFASAMTKGSGSIFVTDGAVQTVIDRVTGQPKLRVVGGTFTKEIMLDQVVASGSHVSFDAAGLPPGATLNIFMGAGTLLSSGRAWAGLSAPGQATFTTSDAVVPPASLTATILLDGDSLKSGEDIGVTITFSKAVALLDPSLLVAANATVGGLATDDGGKTWFATLTGKGATEALASTLRLDLGQVVAGDGGRGAGVVESTPYLVDTLVAAYVAPNIDMTVDTGPFGDDGVSSDDTPVVKGSLYGTMKADEVFELVINGVKIDPAKITIKPADDAGKSDWTYDAAGAARFNPGENTVQVRIVSAGGHSSPAAAKTIVVDTDSPDIVAAPGAAVDLAAPVQVRFNERMYWDDNPEVSRDVKVVDNFGNTTWIDLDERHLSPDRKTVSFNPGDHDLATGNSYRLYLPEGLTDLAGNAYAGPIVEFTTAGPYQDKAPPRLLQAYIVDGNGKYGTGDVLTFRLRYSEKVQLDAGTVPQLDLSNGKSATYAGLSADGTEMIFSYTVAAGDDTAELDVDRPSALAEHVRDEAGNVMLNAHIEFTDLSTAGGDGAMVEIDTIVGTLAKPQLHADSDSGTLGDFITLDTTPRLQGSGAEAGATVSLYAGGVLAGSATADANGNWEFVASALGVGNHQFTVAQQDLAGNVGGRSAALGVDIIALPPAPSAPTLQAGSDTGAASGDRITADTTPTIQGSGATAGSTFTLVHNESTTVLVTANASGNWSHTPAALGDGVHAFTVRYPDVAGHASPDSAALSITVDTVAPSAPGAPRLLAASDTGASDSDGITSDSTPTFTGSEAEAGTTVVLKAGTREIGRTVVGDAGNWTVTVSQADALANAAHDVTIHLVDAAGNASAASSAFSLVIDTVGPGLLGASLNPLLAREFQLRFNEEIVFQPSGRFDLKASAISVANFKGDDNANWYRSDGAGGEDSVLNFKIALGGLLKLQMNNAAIQDLAGNVAVIGVPEWDIDLLGLLF